MSGSELAVIPQHGGLEVAAQRADVAIARLGEWAQSATAAYEVSQRLVQTSFVPQAFRGKPMEATAAILAGAEVGLNPMAALRSFDVIQGTAAPRANTLRAIVQSHGHEIRLVESTETRAIVEGRRRGEDAWQRSTWTIDRAKKMALLGKDNWRKQPQAMLVARATAECARLVASDAILGIGYAAEELWDDDGTVVDPEPVAEAPKRAGRRTIKRAATEAKPAAPTEPARQVASGGDLEPDLEGDTVGDEVEPADTAGNVDRIVKALWPDAKRITTQRRATAEKAARLVDAGRVGWTDGPDGEALLDLETDAVLDADAIDALAEDDSSGDGAIDEPRRRALMARLSELDLARDDDRHAICALASQGRTESSTALTVPEFEQAMLLLDLIAADLAAVSYGPDGTLAVNRAADDKPVRIPMDVVSVRRFIEQQGGGS